MDNLNFRASSPEEKRRILKALEAKVLELEQAEDALTQQDPFYFFVPGKGDITEERRAFLREFLKEEDIPARLTGQDEIFQIDAPIIGLFGGNQSFKTTYWALRAYMFITGECPNSLRGKVPDSYFSKRHPVHVRVTGVDHKTFLKNLLPVYQYWAPRRFLKKGKWDESYSSEKMIVELKRDGVLYGTIEFMTNQMDVESFQGPPRHMMIYDEEPSYEIYKENLMRFVTAERIIIGFGMTPTKGLSWVKSRILDRQQDEQGNRIKCIKVSTVVNPKANLSVVREILKEVDSYDERLMRILGEFISLGGLVYGKLFNRTIHLIEPFPVSWHGYVVYRGLDPHLVKQTYCIELAVDREENKYVIGCYRKDVDIADVKKDLAERIKARGEDERGLRTGWSRCDVSANSDIKALGDRNIYKELSRGENAVPALQTSDKYSGSINAGIDQIKQDLKVNERTGKPRLFIFDIPENWVLVQAFESLERERALNEEKKGIPDKVAEGKYDAHAALRYVYQGSPKWLPPVLDTPEPEGERYI